MGTMSTKRVRTRKPHRCWGCARQVPVGTDIECYTSASEGSITSTYWCDRCIGFYDEHCLPGEEIMDGDLRDYYPEGELAGPIVQTPKLEPADDPRHPGNHSRYKRYGKKCETLDCDRTPGTFWSPYFCQPCNGDRMRRISAQLEALTKPKEQTS